MRVLLTMLIIALLPDIAHAQSKKADEDAIRNVIVQLFNGMEKSDSALVRKAFTKEVTLATIYRTKAGEPAIFRETSLQGFLDAVGKAHTQVWREEFWNLNIAIDGDFAQAWCDYAFYLDHDFSHCGVDAFHLFKDRSGWKIFHLSDTRRKEGCTIPKHIQKKHQ